MREGFFFVGVPCFFAPVCAPTVSHHPLTRHDGEAQHICIGAKNPCKNFLRAWEAKPWVRLSVDGTSKRYFVTDGPHCTAPAAASPLAPLPKPRALPALATHVARGPTGGRGRRPSRARCDAHISSATRIGRNARWHGAHLPPRTKGRGVSRTTVMLPRGEEAGGGEASAE